MKNKTLYAKPQYISNHTYLTLGKEYKVFIYDKPSLYWIIADNGLPSAIYLPNCAHIKLKYPEGKWLLIERNENEWAGKAVK